MPDTYTGTIKSQIALRGHWLTLVQEVTPGALTTWVLVNIAKAMT